MHVLPSMIRPAVSLRSQLRADHSFHHHVRGRTMSANSTPFSSLPKKGATDSAFAGERNSMLALSRHIVSMLLD